MTCDAVAPCWRASCKLPWCVQARKYRCDAVAPCWQPSCQQFWCLHAREQRDAEARQKRETSAAQRATKAVTVSAAIGSGPYATAYAVATGDSEHMTVTNLWHAPAQTPFTELAERLAWICEHADATAVCTAVLDVTPLGNSLVALFTDLLGEAQIRYRRVSLASSPVPGVRAIPRLHVVSAVTRLLEGGRLTLQPGPLTGLAVKAMESYRDAPRSMRAPTTGDEWRAGQDDEFPLALGLAAWQLGIRRTALVPQRLTGARTPI